MNTIGCPYPITKNPNGFFRSQSGLATLKGDLLSLLLTNPGERVMLLNFGTPLRRYFYEPNDVVVEAEAKDIIANAIKTFEPRITVDSIFVSSNFDKSKLNPLDTGTEVDSILGITINFIDPGNIKQIETLVLEIPLNGTIA